MSSTSRTWYLLRLGLALLFACSLAGCSLGTTERVSCTTTLGCRGTFGLGSTCGAAGFCSPAKSIPRCSRSFPADVLSDFAAHKDDILIGALFSFKDNNDNIQAAELAVSQVNDNNGLEGRKFALISCDTTAAAGDQLTDLEAAALGSTFLARELAIPVIVGPRGSGRTQAAFQALPAGQVVVISPSATSPALAAIDNTAPSDAEPGFLWRTVPPDSLQSEVIAADMKSRGVKKVAVIHQTGAYGDSLAALFVERFSADNPNSLVKEAPFSAAGGIGERVSAIAADIDGGNVEEVLFISSDLADYRSFVASATATPDQQQTFAKLGGDGGIFFADTARDAALFKDAGPQSDLLLQKIRGTRLSPAEGAVFNQFAGAYSAKYSGSAANAAFTANSYDAVWLAMFASAWSELRDGGPSALGVARGLRALSSGEKFNLQPSSWALVLDRLARGQTVNVDGASGSLDYDPATEETRAPIETWKVVRAEGTPPWGFARVTVTEP